MLKSQVGFKLQQKPLIGINTLSAYLKKEFKTEKKKIIIGNLSKIKVIMVHKL